MIITAKARNVGIAPRKVGEVVALIRGRSVEDALVILQHVPRKAALAVSKLVASAKANADNNHNMDAKTLQIVEITVGPGMRLKRFRPASRGRALPYVRQQCNILIRVEGQERKGSAPAASDKKVTSKTVKTAKKSAKSTKKETK